MIKRVELKTGVQEGGCVIKRKKPDRENTRESWPEFWRTDVEIAWQSAAGNYINPESREVIRRHAQKLIDEYEDAIPRLQSKIEEAEKKKSNPEAMSYAMQYAEAYGEDVGPSNREILNNWKKRVENAKVNLQKLDFFRKDNFFAIIDELQRTRQPYPDCLPEEIKGIVEEMIQERVDRRERKKRERAIAKQQKKRRGTTPKMKKQSGESDKQRGIETKKLLRSFYDRRTGKQIVIARDLISALRRQGKEEVMSELNRLANGLEEKEIYLAMADAAMLTARESQLSDLEEIGTRDRFELWDTNHIAKVIKKAGLEEYIKSLKQTLTREQDLEEIGKKGGDSYGRIKKLIEDEIRRISASPFSEGTAQKNIGIKKPEVKQREILTPKEISKATEFFDLMLGELYTISLLSKSESGQINALIQEIEKRKGLLDNTSKTKLKREKSKYRMKIEKISKKLKGESNWAEDWMERAKFVLGILLPKMRAEGVDLTEFDKDKMSVFEDIIVAQDIPTDELEESIRDLFE